MQDKPSISASQGAATGTLPMANIRSKGRMMAGESTASNVPHAQLDRSFAAMFSQVMFSGKVSDQDPANVHKTSQSVDNEKTPYFNADETDSKADLPLGSIGASLSADRGKTGCFATKPSRPPLPTLGARQPASLTERKMGRTGPRCEAANSNNAGTVPPTAVPMIPLPEQVSSTMVLHHSRPPITGSQAPVVGQIGNHSPLDVAAPKTDLHTLSDGQTSPTLGLQPHPPADASGLEKASLQRGAPTPTLLVPTTPTGPPIIGLLEAPSEPQLPGVTAALPTQASTTTPAPVPDQIAPALVRLSSADGVRHISLQLAPHDLGAVHIEIEQAASGPAVITLTVQHADTLALLHRDIEQLTKALGRAGFDSSDKTITLHLAPAHLTMPPNDMNLQQSHTGSHSNEAPDNSWQGNSGLSHDFQKSPSESHQQQQPRVTGRSWPEEASDDQEQAMARIEGKQHYRAGLNITA